MAGGGGSNERTEVVYHGKYKPSKISKRFIKRFKHWWLDHGLNQGSFQGSLR